MKILIVKESDANWAYYMGDIKKCFTVDDDFSESDYNDLIETFNILKEAGSIVESVSLHDFMSTLGYDKVDFLEIKDDNG